MDNCITRRLLSNETIEEIARDCIERGITANARIAEEISDAVCEGYIDASDDDDCEDALKCAIAAIEETSENVATAREYADKAQTAVLEIYHIIGNFETTIEDLDECLFNAKTAAYEAEKAANHTNDEDLANSEFMAGEAKKFAHSATAEARRANDAIDFTKNQVW